MTFPSESLKRLAWTHKLAVNMTCWPIERRTFNGNCSSSMDPWPCLFLCSVNQCAIGILSYFNMCLLCSAIGVLVGYKWIDCWKEQFSTSKRHEIVLVVRSAQSSIVGVPFRRFSKSCRKAVWEGLFPCCRKFVSSVIKVSNLCHKAVPTDEPVLYPNPVTNMWWDP